jgi:lipoprotein-anchoring transpeptidase ErfK/SrfK
MKAGKYRFTVTALGQYGDISATSAPVSLLPKPPVVAAAGCGYLIDVNLTSQSMVASRCGVVFITSPITSGRPGYRSPTGTFYTSTKYQHVWFEYHGLYTPRYVKYAIRFWGLYYLHTWSQPALSDFGPGSQNGQYASLGCIEMPDNVMAAIYNWEPTGTAVRIHY